MVVVAPNNGTSGNELPPPRIPRHMEHDEMVEKLNKLNNWSVKREDRYGPLASRWYKAQEKPGAVSSYHLPIRVPTAMRGARPPYSLPFYAHDSLRGPPSPPKSARREPKVIDRYPTLPWKTEWYGQARNLEKPGSRFADTFHVSRGGEGMAPSHDIGNVGLLSRKHEKPRDTWTASRPLASPERATVRLRRLETRSIPRLTGRHRPLTGMSNLRQTM